MDLPFLIRAVGVPVFAYAAVSDWKHRRAPNYLWGLLTALGVIALALEVAQDPNRIAIAAGVLVSTIMVSAISISGWCYGYIGGADAKAGVVIPIIFPHVPLQSFESTVFGTFTQGVEAVGWVFTGTAIAAVWYTTLIEKKEGGFPFLVPLFAGILSLFFVSIFVI